MREKEDMVLVTTKAICREVREGQYDHLRGYKIEVSAEPVNHHILAQYRLCEQDESTRNT